MDFFEIFALIMGTAWAFFRALLGDPKEECRP